MSVYFDSTKGKWIVRITKDGVRKGYGAYNTRDEAEMAAAKVLVTPRQTARDVALRAKALSVARMQFAGGSPEALIDAANELYLWLRDGTIGNRQETPAQEAV